MNTGPDRGIWIPDRAHRADLGAFVERGRRLDDSAVVRLRIRTDGRLVAWIATSFDVLASRVVEGVAKPGDLSCGADELARGIENADGQGHIDPGYAMDSAWRGVLPPESGFVHLDDVPVAVIADLGRRGADLVREHGSAHGPPVSLLDQEVLQVSGPGDAVGIPMRCVFALTAMGFVPEDADGEVVRVRVMPSWLRIDARFGSVYRRRGDPALVLR
jgi:hypothetical protein